MVSPQTKTQQTEDSNAQASSSTGDAPGTQPGNLRKKKRGGQPGNQNASKGGIYSSLFTGNELAFIATATWTPDDVTAMLLVAIKRALEKKASLDSIARGADSYIRALKARYLLSGDAAKNLESAFAQALDELSAELGLPL